MATNPTRRLIQIQNNNQQLSVSCSTQYENLDSLANTYDLFSTFYQIIVMYLFTTFVLFFLTAFLYVYWFFKKSHKFFDECGIPSYAPSWFFGSMKDVVLMRRNFVEGYKDLYEKLHKTYKFVGIYNLHKPQLLVCDPELIKTILVKDFGHFHDRGFTICKEVEPLANHLASLSGDEWRNLRIKLTCTFTSGKMKMMFSLLKKCAEDMHPVLSEYFKNDETFEVKDFCARYTTDVIGSCAFGIDTHSLRDPESEFRKMGRVVFQPKKRMMFRMFFPQLPAKYIKLFKLEMFPSEINDYFTNIVRDMVKYREENNVTRGDFLDLLIAMKNHTEMEKLKDHDDADLTKFMAQIGEKYVKNDVEMTIEVMAAQCFLFFVGGFEGASNTLTYLIFELTQHPDIQNKLREEIVSVLESNGGELTYDMMKKMTYLEMVIAETLRKYPLGPLLLRECTETYKMPDSDGIIKKGTSVVIPLAGINADPQYYEKPEDFYPEHFTPEAISQRPHFAYLPFGEGPRVCIAERFARMQIIVGAVYLLKDFSFELSPKTKVPLEIIPTGGSLMAKGGVWVKCRPVKS